MGTGHSDDKQHFIIVEWFDCCKCLMVDVCAKKNVIVNLQQGLHVITFKRLGSQQEDLDKRIQTLTGSNTPHFTKVKWLGCCKC